MSVKQQNPLYSDTHRGTTEISLKSTQRNNTRTENKCIHTLQRPVAQTFTQTKPCLYIVLCLCILSVSFFGFLSWPVLLFIYLHHPYVFLLLLPFIYSLKCRALKGWPEALRHAEALHTHTTQLHNARRSSHKSYYQHVLLLPASCLKKEDMSFKHEWNGSA